MDANFLKSLLKFGEVAEWSKAAVLKTAVPARVPWVRIPPSPQKNGGALLSIGILLVVGLGEEPRGVDNTSQIWQSQN